MSAPATPRETRGGETLSARMWAALEAAYAAAGLDPDVYLVVTHGSWDHYSGSGSTHDGGGAADLRVWNLPPDARADLCRDLVVELRRRLGLAVWYRDATHGGMDPHIHALMADEPGLASGAVWQLGEAEAGRNGLSSGGPDYHPRPAWEPFTYPPRPRQEPDMVIIRQGSRWRLITGDRAVGLGETDARAFTAAGVPLVSLTPDGFDKLTTALVAE